MDHCPPDRRRSKRYRFDEPVRVYVRERLLPGTLRNLSSDGALLQCVSPLAPGTPVRAEIDLANHTIQQVTGTSPRLTFLGIVLRTTPDGTALRFLHCASRPREFHQCQPA